MQYVPLRFWIEFLVKTRKQLLGCKNDLLYCQSTRVSMGLPVPTIQSCLCSEDIRNTPTTTPSAVKYNYGQCVGVYSVPNFLCVCKLTTDLQPEQKAHSTEDPVSVTADVVALEYLHDYPDSSCI